MVLQVKTQFFVTFIFGPKHQLKRNKNVVIATLLAIKRFGSEKTCNSQNTKVLITVNKFVFVHIMNKVSRLTAL